MNTYPPSCIGTFAVFLIGVFLLSCVSVPKTSYRDKGLSFVITPDFRFGKPSTFKENHATYIPIHLINKNVYAKFSVVWIPCRSDLEWEIRNYVDGLNSVYASDT